MKKLLKKGLIPLFAAVFCAPSFGQAEPSAITGSYQMIGRRCEDGGKKLVPPDDSAQKIFFESDGSFRHTYFIINAPLPAEGELTIEEHAERRRERRIARFLEYFEEDKERHEALCKEHGSVDDGRGRNACESRYKKEMYERWREERIAEAERELELAEEEDKKFLEENTKECFMELEGRWTAEGSRLTIFPGRLSVSEGCGAEGSYPSRMEMSYYMEDATLYIVNQASEASREHCGSADWAEIYVK